MTTLVFGAGFLGRRLATALPDAALSTVDITDADAVRAAITTADATVVVNAAGKTGRPNVDWCEQHADETWRSNVLGALVLAEACHARGVHLLHLSSGCIFDGPSPTAGGWREDDPPTPASLYARSKHAAEERLAPYPQVAIVRMRMPIDHAPHPRNLITKLAGYRHVIDVDNSVTVVDDLIAVVAGLARQRATGVFHATNPGVLRHRELLARYRELVDPDHACTFIGPDELVHRGLATAPRSNCLLASSRLAAHGLAMRPIASVLDEVLRSYRLAVASGAHGLDRHPAGPR